MNKKEEEQESSTRISAQKEDVITIKHPAGNWKFGQILSLQNNNALLLTLEQNKAMALLLKRNNVKTEDVVDQLSSFPIQLKWGSNQSCLGTQFDNFEGNQISEIDLTEPLPKADLKRDLVDSQLYSGHIRIDLGQSMTRGNFILLKGERKTGKSSVALSTAKLFLKEENTKVVFVSMSKQYGSQLVE